MSHEQSWILLLNLSWILCVSVCRCRAVAQIPRIISVEREVPFVFLIPDSYCDSNVIVNILSDDLYPSKPDANIISGCDNDIKNILSGLLNILPWLGLGFLKWQDICNQRWNKLELLGDKLTNHHYGACSSILSNERLPWRWLTNQRTRLCRVRDHDIGDGWSWRQCRVLQYVMLKLRGQDRNGPLIIDIDKLIFPNYKL